MHFDAKRTYFAGQWKKEMKGNVLLVDAGNSRWKMSEYQNGILGPVFYFDLSDKHGFQQWFQDKTWEKILVINSGQMESSIQTWLDNRPFILLKNSDFNNIKWAYAQPENLGKDRAAALSAVVALYPGRAIMIADAGTCMTLDFVSPQALHLGGVISPGLTMRAKAMHDHTTFLPMTTKNDVGEIWGKSTTECLASGAVFGMLAEIEYHFTAFSNLGFEQVQLILTGGDADFLAQRLKVSNFVRSDLVFQGMIVVLASLE